MEKEADKFSIYVLTEFRAEENNFDSDTQYNDLNYDWDAFVSWITQLEKNNNFISHARLDMMYSTIYGMTTENNAKFYSLNIE